MLQRAPMNCKCCSVQFRQGCVGPCKAFKAQRICTAGSAGSSVCAGKSRGLLRSRHSAPVLVAEAPVPAGSPAPAAAAAKVPEDAEACGMESQHLARQGAAREQGGAKTPLPVVVPLPETGEFWRQLPPGCPISAWAAMKGPRCGICSCAAWWRKSGGTCSSSWWQLQVWCLAC